MHHYRMWYSGESVSARSLVPVWYDLISNSTVSICIGPSLSGRTPELACLCLQRRLSRELEILPQYDPIQVPQAPILCVDKYITEPPPRASGLFKHVDKWIISMWISFISIHTLGTSRGIYPYTDYGKFGIRRMNAKQGCIRRLSKLAEGACFLWSIDSTSRLSSWFL